MRIFKLAFCCAKLSKALRALLFRLAIHGEAKMRPYQFSDFSYQWSVGSGRDMFSNIDNAICATITNARLITDNRQP
jgi:hypothetical protein